VPPSKKVWTAWYFLRGSCDTRWVRVRFRAAQARARNPRAAATNHTSRVAPHWREVGLVVVGCVDVGGSSFLEMAILATYFWGCKPQDPLSEGHIKGKWDRG